MAKKYTVRVDGFIAGAYRKKGDVISLTDRAAKYLVMGGLLVEAPARSADVDDKPAGRRRRSEPEPELSPAALDMKTR